MAITIISNLTSNRFYASANPINITVSSNNSGKCNFRYICDVYINGINVFRDKLFPDPSTGYGFFQMSRVLNDYIKTSINKTNYSAVINAAANLNAPSAAFSLYFRFGEEYDNTINCSGSVNQYLNLATSNTSFVFEAAIDYEDWPTFDYNNYFIGTQSASTQFLTNTQKEIDLTYNDPYTLDFITSASIGASYSVRLVRYFNDGSTSTTNYTASTLGQRRRFRLAVGPIDLNRIAASALITPFVNYYTIQLRFASNNISELFTFKLKAPQKYRTRIGFVGLLGGIEHFTFYHRNVKSYEIERKMYAKTLQSNYSGSWSYEVGDRGDSVYQVSAQQVNAVASYCDKPTSEWLYEMWLSPQVWTYKRPELYIFTPFQDGIYVKYWVEESHGLKAGDAVFSFSDNNDFNGRFTVVSVNGNIVDFGLLYSVYGSTMQGTCGWVQKDEAWQILPIVISDNTIEVKVRTARPIEYALNYRTAYQKTTLRG